MPVQKKTFWIIYVLGFLWSLSFALPLYMQSSFVDSIVGVDNVGLVVFITNVCSLLSLVGYGYLIKRYSNFRVSTIIILFNLAAVIFLLLTQGIWSLVFYVVIFLTMNLFSVNLDVFLESISDDRVTGRIRTTMLTIINIAIFISPVMMGYIIGDDNYRRVYLVAGIVFLPVLLLLFFERQLVADHTLYRERSFKTLRKIFAFHPNLPRLFFVEFALRFFYATMVLYVPIYLHQYLGFGWDQIGPIFTFMLLPFILLQIPAGRLADKLWGEKEMIIAGLLFMAVFTGAVVFLQSQSILIWGLILFCTRVGAALVEAMNETYFFKHVSKEDMDLINLFRDLRPFGWLVAALASFILLHLFVIQSAFVAIIAVLLIALWPALRLVDTK